MNYDEIFDVFNSTYVGKEIKKEVILDKLSNIDDKEIIERFVTNIFIKYSVKSEVINKKAEENFEEIQILEININNYRAIYDIYGILLSIIPYPILALFRYNDRISYAVSNRILDENKNNKGKIYTSCLIKAEDISQYLKIDINDCQTMIDIYNKWILNIENVIAYYERLDRVIEIIEIGLHIKSNEVLEKLESYIERDCGTYNMKPKEGWNSKLEKYSDSSSFVKKVETHILWEYLSENTFLKNRLEEFSNWNEFKETCSYNNNLNDMYYSQYNSRMSDNDEIDYIYENNKKNRYKNHNTNIKVEIIRKESEHNNIEVLENEKNNEEIVDYEFNEYQKQLLLTIENEPTALEQAKYELKDNSAFMLQAINVNSECIQYASDRLKNDSDFMLSINEINERNLGYASDRLKANKDFILSAAETNIWALAFATDELRNDKEFVSQIVEKNSWTLKHASDELKNDKDIVIKAIKNDAWFLAYARNELRNNREFLLEAINKNKECMAFANDNMKKEILIEINKKNSLIDKQKDNEKYILELIKKDYFNVRFASDRLKNDSDFMLKAIESSDTSFKCLAFASEELKANKDFILKLFNTIGSYMFALASEKLKGDKEFILKLLEYNYLDFAYVNYELRCDKKFMMDAISINAETIEFASYELRNDKEFMLQAIKKNSLCFVYASDELKNNKEFMLQAIDMNCGAIEFAKDIFRNDKDIILAALKIDEYSLSLFYASDRLKNDKEFMLQAIDINGKALKYLGDRLKNDSDFILKAFKKNTKSIEYASDELKANKDFMREISKIIENSIFLEFDYVYKQDFLNRNERYGIVGFLEGNDISILEKDEFCMKIVKRRSGEIIECNHTPLRLVNDILKEPDMENTFILNWKLHLSGTTEENLKFFDSYMRRIGMTYSIYRNNKDGKEIIIEYTNKSIKFEVERNPLRQYINQYTNKNEDSIIIQLYDMQPNIMMDLSNVLYLWSNNNSIKYRDYIAVLPKRNSFGSVWHYSMKNNIKYIYLLSWEILKISENIIKQIEDYFLKHNTKYYIEKKIDDIILTMYPRKIEEIDFIINILETNNIEYELNELDDLEDSLDRIEFAPTSLWIFETTKEEKEEISKILSEINEDKLSRLNELGAPESVIRAELAPVNCDYGIIIDSKLQSSIENILQSLNIKYRIKEKEQYISES